VFLYYAMYTATGVRNIDYIFVITSSYLILGSVQMGNNRCMANGNKLIFLSLKSLEVRRGKTRSPLHNSMLHID